MATKNINAAFTICSWNYMAYARTLAKSFEEHNKDMILIIFVADTPQPEIMDQLTDIELFVVDDDIVSPYKNMSAIYSIMEFNTAIKPFCFDFMFDKLHFDNVIYLDPDIYVTGDFRPLLELFDKGEEALLTPHITSSLDDGFHPSDLDILRSGVYNLGFIGLKNTRAVRAYLTWWRRWLTASCVVAIEEGIFVDQKFCDMVPAFIEKSFVLHDLGYNVAYWNLSQRRLTVDPSGRLLASGYIVRFIHFSGVNKDRPDEFSKHQNRFTRRTIGLLAPIFDNYVFQLQSNDKLVGDGETVHNGPSRFSQIAYGFGETDGLLPQHSLIQKCIQRYKQSTLHRASVRELNQSFLLEPSDDIPNGDGCPVSRLLAEVYFARRDLRESFDCQTLEGRIEFTRWANENLTSEHELPLEWAIPPSLLTSSNLTNADLAAAKDGDSDAREPSLLGSRLRRFLKGFRIPDLKLRKASSDDAPKPDSQAANETEHGLSIYGFFRSETGVGQSARGLADAFASTGLPYSAHAILSPHSANNVSYACEDLNPSRFDSSLLILNADNICVLEEWMDPGYVARTKKIGFYVWELPVFPAVWAKAIDGVDEIWVPSGFVADSMRSACTKPVHVVPYPVCSPVEIEPLAARDMLKLPHDRLIYLITFDFNSFPERKNAIGAIRAFVDAFPSESDVGPILIVKFHGIFNRDSYLPRIKSLVRGRSDIIVIDVVYSAAEMRALQAAADIYVSLHRSEGFGLNLAECMSIGKLVVGTAFSGNLEFMKADNSVLIDYDMRAVRDDEYVAWHGQWWAEPIHEHAVEALRMAERDQCLRHDRGLAAKEHIMHVLSPDVIGQKMSALIGAGRP